MKAFHELGNLKDVGGETIDLRETKGKVVLCVDLPSL
jgi:hypothetical protein